MILIEFTDYCRNVYDQSDLANQGLFVEEIFKAAGSGYSFNTSDKFSNSNYPTKLFNGSKSISGTIRRSFPNPILKKGVAEFLTKHIAAEKVRAVMNSFCIPQNAEESITAIAWALAEQMQIIIHEPEKNNDVVASEFQRYINETSEKLFSPFQPLYDGDSYWNQSERCGTYTVDFYKKITHEWVIKNTGRVEWVDRQLVCTNHKSIPPRASVESINIPVTKPGGIVRITAEFDARGVEGVFFSTWSLVNANGDDCFPNSGGSLTVQIRVVNEAFYNGGITR